MKTGQGKGNICALVAIIYFLYGCNSDIISSSSVLAERDAGYEDG